MRSQIWSTHMYNILYIVYGMYTGRFTDKREGWAHQYHQLWLLLSAFGRNILLQPFAAVLLWEPSFVHPFSVVLNLVHCMYCIESYCNGNPVLFTLFLLFSTMSICIMQWDNMRVWFRCSAPWVELVEHFPMLVFFHTPVHWAQESPQWTML